MRTPCSVGGSLGQDGRASVTGTPPPALPCASPLGLKGNNLSLLPEIAEAFGAYKRCFVVRRPAISLPLQEPPDTGHSGFWVQVSVGGEEGWQRVMVEEGEHLGALRARSESPPS